MKAGEGYLSQGKNSYLKVIKMDMETWKFDKNMAMDTQRTKV